MQCNAVQCSAMLPEALPLTNQLDIENSPSGDTQAFMDPTPLPNPRSKARSL